MVWRKPAQPHPSMDNSSQPSACASDNCTAHWASGDTAAQPPELGARESCPFDRRERSDPVRLLNKPDVRRFAVGFEKLGEATGTQPKSLVRMFGPRGSFHASLTNQFWCALGPNQIVPSTVISAATSRFVSSAQPLWPVTVTSTFRQPIKGAQTPCWGHMSGLLSRYRRNRAWKCRGRTSENTWKRVFPERSPN